MRQAGMQQSQRQLGRRGQPSCAVARRHRPQKGRRALLVRAESAAKTVLAADIGGTNARLSLWSADGDASKAQLFTKKYPTKEHPAIQLVISAFLNDARKAGPEPSYAVLAVAGAVADNKCNLTNAEWFIDGDALSADNGFPVRLINDFEAVGYAIPALGASDLVVLNKGVTVPQAPKVVTGPGTGLGAAQLVWDQGLQDYKVLPGEGAHATFAPRGWKQYALGMYAMNKFNGHVEIEQVACGSGLELIYEFLASDEPVNRQGMKLGKAAMTLPDGKPKVAKNISDAALDGSDPLAQEAVDMLMGIVGGEAGAMALRVLAKGGAYIAGGITPILLPRLQNNLSEGNSLLEGFLNPKAKEDFHEILKTIPLSVITNDKVGEIGARQVAVKLLQGKAYK